MAALAAAVAAVVVETAKAADSPYILGACYCRHLLALALRPPLGTTRIDNLACHLFFCSGYQGDRTAPMPQHHCCSAETAPDLMRQVSAALGL
jgi:hypothetical protein